MWMRCRAAHSHKKPTEPSCKQCSTSQHLAPSESETYVDHVTLVCGYVENIQNYTLKGQFLGYDFGFLANGYFGHNQWPKVEFKPNVSSSVLPITVFGEVYTNIMYKKYI